jgi:hypothetical protein
MTADLARGVERFLDGISALDREQAESVLSACPTVEIDGDGPCLRSAVAGALLLIVEGFVVLRATERGG